MNVRGAGLPGSRALWVEGAAWSEALTPGRTVREGGAGSPAGSGRVELKGGSPGQAEAVVGVGGERLRAQEGQRMLGLPPCRAGVKNGQDSDRSGGEGV